MRERREKTTARRRGGLFGPRCADVAVADASNLRRCPLVASALLGGSVRAAAARSSGKLAVASRR